MSFSLRNFKIHSPAIFDQCWWSPTRIILMYSIIIRQTFRLQLLLLLLLPSWIDKWEPGCLKEESQVILNLNLPRNSGKKTLQMWKRNDQLGRATRHWSKHECMATPQHFGRLHGKQVKWWQSGKSSWEASLFLWPLAFHSSYKGILTVGFVLWPTTTACLRCAFVSKENSFSPWVTVTGI